MMHSICHVAFSSLPWLWLHPLLPSLLSAIVRTQAKHGEDYSRHTRALLGVATLTGELKVSEDLGADIAEAENASLLARIKTKSRDTSLVALG
ncbi:hypothetical protein Tco_0564361 [Tanacetum coccineum]